MATEHYDLIVIGAGLSEQIAATLLAGQGYRVLSFPATFQAEQQTLACCPALNKLLKSLKGENYLRDSIDSVQLVTDDIRLQLGGPLPLADELRREFPDHHDSMLALLDQLDAWGCKLSLLLTRTAPNFSLLPLRLLALYQRQLSNNLPARKLQQPILQILRTLGAPKPQQTLNQLLSGICLVTPERLSVAEAALKWHITTRPRNIMIAELSQLLTERYAASSGQNIPLDELAAIKQTGKHPTGVRLLNGKALSARQFLVGPLPKHIKLDTALASTIAKPPCEPRRWILSGLPLQRPPMLARQVILAGKQTLSLTWDHESPLPGQALLEDVRPAALNTLDTETVLQQLSSLLPFTNFELTETGCSPREMVMHNSFWPRGGLPRPAASNVLFCHAAHLLPSLGVNADVILGQAAATTLQKRLG
ncbi:MAG: hypothetical protein K8R55_08355 [Desulfuromonadaceae bacterium]|nr:hypothetical protein [Desulfuromonadaceae bacterium]